MKMPVVRYTREKYDIKIRVTGVPDPRDVRAQGEHVRARRPSVGGETIPDDTCKERESELGLDNSSCFATIVNIGDKTLKIDETEEWMCELLSFIEYGESLVFHSVEPPAGYDFEILNADKPITGHREVEIKLTMRNIFLFITVI